MEVQNVSNTAVKKAWSLVFSCVLGHCSNSMAIMHNTAFLFLFSSLSLAGRQWTVLSSLGGEVVGICPEGWSLNSGSWLQCSSAAEDGGVQALPRLTFFLQALGGFVSILDFVPKYLMLPWELREICVLFWAVWGSKSGVFSSLTSGLWPFISFTGSSVKPDVLMQNKTCLFWTDSLTKLWF